MSTKPTKTKHAGVWRRQDGRYLIRASQRTGGKQRDTVRTLKAGTTIAEAVRARSALVTQLAAKVEAAAQPEAWSPSRETAAPTFTSFVLQWAKHKSPGLRASTRAHYTSVIAERILPHFDGLRVDEITRMSVLGWVTKVQALTNRSSRPYATATLRSWWRPLASILKDCAAEYGLPDPTVRVRPPESTVSNVREQVTLTPAQVGRLLEVIKTDWPQWYAEAYLLAFTGLRAGELHALEWGDIDDARGVLHVGKAVWKGKVGQTKTGAAREVALTEPIREVLRKHRQAMVREQHEGLASGLMFPSDKGGHRFASSLKNTLAKAAKTAGIETRVGPQVMRRSLNTSLLELGVDAVILRSQMGHASEQMTQLYAGIHPEAKRAAVDLLHRAVTGE